jgi:hypothetical protein
MAPSAPSRTFTPKSFVISVNQRSFKDPENTNAGKFTVGSQLLVINRAGASGAIRCKISSFVWFVVEN